jgi:hypothetical protein
MSEFKFACPVCGQHMRCDTSQGGSVMECPTCFQKIVAPQAPAPDAKFILTGTKLSEKKTTVRGVDAPATGVTEKNFPLALVIGLALACATAVAGFLIFHAQRSRDAKPLPAKTAATTNAAPAKPVLVAPPANDANWRLRLDTNAIPDTPVVGRIHGQDFIIERASFSTNGTLTLRAGTKGALEFGVQINFGGAQPESLSGQILNVAADTDKAAKISLRWKDATGAIQKANYDRGYAMRLEFGALANSRLPGKIWLCLPDAEKSYLLGTFNADARKPKPKPPKK